MARRITASAALAEDAVQEAFAGRWQAPRSYPGARGSVRNWLLALTRHKAVDLVRRETAERRLTGPAEVFKIFPQQRPVDPRIVVPGR